MNGLMLHCGGQVKTRDEVFAVPVPFSHNGMRFFGLLGLEMPGHNSTLYRSVLGLRNSYDKSFSTGVCIGASVFVSDNLSFNGEVSFAGKWEDWEIVFVRAATGLWTSQSRNYSSFGGCSRSRRNSIKQIFL